MRCDVMCLQLQLSDDFLRGLEEDHTRRTKLLREAEAALRAEETSKQSSDSVEAAHRTAINSARLRARTAEAEVAKKLQLLQLKLDSLDDARKQAETAIRLHESSGRSLLDDQRAIASIQTDIDGLIQELKQRLTTLSSASAGNKR